MPPLSAVILTCNDEQHIERCIRSVKPVADEILVLDAGSTDRTADIARALGAQVKPDKFRGHARQKTTAMQAAAYNYILYLDARETLSDELQESVAAARKTFSRRLYTMNRCTRYCGKDIRHGNRYPDKTLRLFDRRIVQWKGSLPGDGPVPEKKFPVQQLRGDLCFDGYPTPEDLAWHYNRLSSVEASTLYREGNRSSWLHMLCLPGWTFFRGYVLKRGFLDGFAGFSLAVYEAHAVFQKYSKLYRLQHKVYTGEPFVIKQVITENKTIAGEL